MATVYEGAQPTNTPDPDAVKTRIEGPVPTILARSKPENSLRPRDGVSSSLVDGPFGGKRPQS